MTRQPTEPYRLRNLRAVDPDNPNRTDVTAAGRVLALMALTLVLAAVFNSGRQAERASQMPLGQDRDRLLAIWEPVDGVSGAVGLQIPRDLLESVRYGSDSDTADDPGSEGDSEQPTPTIAAPVTSTTLAGPRVPTAADPLRVMIVGDSTVETAGGSLQRLLNDTGVVESLLDHQKSSGFSRPDFFDWPVHLESQMAAENPELVMAMFGGNDAQGFVEEGVVLDFGTPEWIATYGDRVQRGMEIMAGADDPAASSSVYFLGQPLMRDADFNARMQLLNQIYEERAALVEGVTFLPTVEAVTPNGYAAFGPGTDGTEEQLRESDGIHLTGAGGRVLAAFLYARLVADGFVS